MSDWGEDQYDEEGIDAQPIDINEAGTPVRAFGLDIGGLAGEFVDAAVKASVRKHVADVANTAVKQALTPELLDTLRSRAAQAAAAAVTEQVKANDTEQAAPEAGEQPEPGLYYGSVDEFVREYLRNVYRRRIDGRHRCWAGQWWRYDEAVIRLEALWRAWEHLRQDPATGMSVWWRDHADHHMAVLMDPDGPFALAAEGEDNMTKKGDPLPYLAPPAGMFPDVREGPNLG